MSNHGAWTSVYHIWMGQYSIWEEYKLHRNKLMNVKFDRTSRQWAPSKYMGIVELIQLIWKFYFKALFGRGFLYRSFLRFILEPIRRSIWLILCFNKIALWTYTGCNPSSIQFLIWLRHKILLQHYFRRMNPDAMLQRCNPQGKNINDFVGNWS